MEEEKKRLLNLNPPIVMDFCYGWVGNLDRWVKGDSADTRTLKCKGFGAVFPDKYEIYDLRKKVDFIHIPSSELRTSFDWIIVFNHKDVKYPLIKKILDEDHVEILSKWGERNELINIQESALRARQRKIEKRPWAGINEKVREILASPNKKDISKMEQDGQDE